MKTKKNTTKLNFSARVQEITEQNIILRGIRDAEGLFLEDIMTLKMNDNIQKIQGKIHEGVILNFYADIPYVFAQDFIPHDLLRSLEDLPPENIRAVKIIADHKNQVIRFIGQATDIRKSPETGELFSIGLMYVGDFDNYYFQEYLEISIENFRNPDKVRRGDMIVFKSCIRRKSNSNVDIFERNYRNEYEFYNFQIIDIE